MKIPLFRAVAFSSVAVFLLSCAVSGRGQSQLAPRISASENGAGDAGRDGDSFSVSPHSNFYGPMPAAVPPSPREKPVEPYPTNFYQAPWSRIGIGADVSPLGIGIKSAIVLNTYMDARLMGNFFNYNNGRIETQGFNVYAKIHMESMAAAVDVYPWHSVWRLSVGTLFENSNQLSARFLTAPGTGFTLNGQTFYAANANAATGATPLNGNVLFGLNRIKPALTLSGGFGQFIPRSQRHWSFPSEFGVAFTGSPIVQVNTAGWVCTDKAQTTCSHLGDAGNPVAIQFNDALQTKLAKVRKSLGAVQIYPIFSYSVVYSFNTPW